MNIEAEIKKLEEAMARKMLNEGEAYKRALIAFRALVGLQMQMRSKGECWYRPQLQQQDGNVHLTDGFEDVDVIEDDFDESKIVIDSDDKNYVNAVTGILKTSRCYSIAEYLEQQSERIKHRR